MGHWNYRVTRERWEDEDGETGYLHEVRQIYYHDDGQLSWSKDPSHPSGDSWLELATDLEMFRDSLEHDVLDIDTKEWLSPDKSGTDS